MLRQAQIEVVGGFAWDPPSEAIPVGPIASLDLG